jgi:holliday junction DNA helicase RuvA
MIAHLRGILIAKTPNRLVVEAAGVGYDVTISVPTYSELPSLGSEVALHIHTHVREDAIALFGFLNLKEKQLFERLLTVTGIGPKLAITILSGMSADDLVGAICGSDVARLTRVPGVGKKTAERMALELRDKLEDFGRVPTAQATTPVEEDVLSALVNLGYPRSAVQSALASVLRDNQGASFEVLFRETMAAILRK